MMSLRRRVTIVGVVVVTVSTLVAGGLLWFRSPGGPRPFPDDTGRPVTGSISEKVWVDVNGVLATTDHLRQQFHQDKIYLLGHSWGSFIAIQAAARSPQRFHAYLGTGQMVFQQESENRAYDHMLAAYRRSGDAAMVRDLEAAPVTMTSGTPRPYLELRDAAMHELGIGTTRDMRSVITGIFLPSWTFRGYTLREKVDLRRGRSFSQGFGLWERILQVDLRKVVPRLRIPVYFLEGRYDYTCNIDLAREYLRVLDAPVKGFCEFADSAHTPVLEEPGKVHRVLQVDVLTGGDALADLR